MLPIAAPLLLRLISFSKEQVGKVVAVVVVVVVDENVEVVDVEVVVVLLQSCFK